MSVFICELCGHEIKINLKNKDPKDIVCPLCHKNGKIEDGIWVPTLKERAEKMDKIKSEIKNKGCKGCDLYIPKHYCVDNVTCCPYLLERDFFAGRLSEEEYKKESKAKKD